MFGIPIERDNEIEKIASDAWGKFSGSRLPVSTRDVISAVGILLYRLPTQSKFDAVLDLSGNYPPYELGLRARREYEKGIPYQHRMRFTEAHELGHFFLHDNIREIHRENYETVVEAVADGNFVLAEREIEANSFAAALLMPTSVFKADLQVQRIRGGESWLMSLMHKYDVSFMALDARIARLRRGFILSGYAWEDSGTIQNMIPSLDLEYAYPAVAKEAWRCNPHVRNHAVRNLPVVLLSDFHAQVGGLHKNDLAEARIEMDNVRLADTLPGVDQAICGCTSICGCNKRGPKIHFTIELPCAQ